MVAVAGASSIMAATGGGVTEHGGGETVGAGIVVEQVADDVAAAHVGGALEPGFTITVAPVPARDGEGGIGGEHGLNFGQIAVGGLHEIEHRAEVGAGAATVLGGDRLSVKEGSGDDGGGGQEG